MSGYFIDLLGRPLCLSVFLVLVTIGQVVFSVSAHDSINSYWLAIIGRLLFGAFGKSVTGNLFLQFLVAQSAYITDWFRTRELALGLGMATCIGRAGTVLNFFIAYKTYSLTKSIAFAFWCGTLLIELSVISGISAILIDQHVEIKTNYTAKQAQSKKISLSDLKSFSKKFWFIVFSLVGFYLGFLCFVNISVSFAKVKFGFSDDTAGFLAVFPSLRL
jgi:hypothetical protein